VNPAPTQPLARHIRETLVLAAPIIVARAAVLVMVVMDTMMTGWAGAGELASLGLGVAPQLTFQMVAIGFLQAVPVLTAQATGAGNEERAGTVFRSGLVHAGLLGCTFLLLSLFSEEFFRFLDQPEAIVERAATVSISFAAGMPGMLLFVACNMFLEATGRPKTGMAVMIVVGAIDFLLNGIFVLGWWGIAEPMGALGAVITSSVMRWLAFFVTLAVLLGWERRLGDRRRVLAALAHPLQAGGDIGRQLRRIGLPVGLAHGVESAAFTAMVFIGGMISTEALAAHQATLSVTGLIYMVAVGIAGATAIRVGHAFGRRAFGDVRLAGWSGILVAGTLAFPFALMFRVAPESVAGLYGLSGPALAIAGATVAIAGYVLVFDAMMAGTLGALRGTGDVWMSFAIQTGAFWIVAVPLAAVLGLRLQAGAPGLIWGILGGVLISFALLGLRFWRVSSRAVARM
jgi:MATE family multidrug resistance protein